MKWKLYIENTPEKLQIEKRLTATTWKPIRMLSSRCIKTVLDREHVCKATITVSFATSKQIDTVKNTTLIKIDTYCRNGDPQMKSFKVTVKDGPGFWDRYKTNKTVAAKT